MYNKKTFSSLLDSLLIFFLFIIPVGISFVRKTSIWGYVDFLKYSDEVIMIIMFPLAVRGGKQIWRIRPLKKVIFFMLLYYIIGFISGFIRSVPLKLMLFQSFLDGKFLIIFFTLAGLQNPKKAVRYFVQSGKFILLLSIPLCGWQLFDIEGYNALFNNGGHFGLFHSASAVGESLQRAAGIFWFPGTLAHFSGIMLFFLLFKFIEKKNIVNLSWSIVAAFLLLLTLSRGEIMFAILSILLVIVIHTKRPTFKVLSISLNAIFVFSAVYIFYDILYFMFNSYGLEDILSSNAARVVFYIKSYAIANDHIPFGTGFGTFGGHIANIFDSQVYIDYNFNSYWWYQGKLFMTDTFWPHILGEAGWIGLLSYLIAYLFLLRFSLIIIRLHSTPTTKSLLASILFLFLTSLQAPSFTVGYLLVISLIGIAPAIQLFSQHTSNSTNYRLKGEYSLKI